MNSKTPCIVLSEGSARVIVEKLLRFWNLAIVEHDGKRTSELHLWCKST